MITSPESYIEELEDKSMDSEEWDIDPSSDVIYQENLEYLAEL